MAELTKEQFEIDKRKNDYLAYWYKASLPLTKEKNPNKSILECFKVLYKELRMCQLIIARPKSYINYTDISATSGIIGAI